MSDNSMDDRPKLRRRLNLPLLTLYGLGVTIGAGIYVLVGATAAKAGIYAPISFLLAAGVVGFTGFAYCELGTRYPVSAGEAAYVRQGFNSRTLSLIVGLMVVASGVVSSAAVAIGAAAYLEAFVPLSPQILTALVILLVGLVAVWGILESVALAALFTVIEIGGLALVVWFGLAAGPAPIANLVPPFEAGAWSGILAAGLLAFFAFVGFEDIANVAEEVKQPGRTLPRGIILTLIIATLIYFTVVSVVVLVVPMHDLVGSAAPLALIFETAGPGISMLFSVIAIIATVNGALIQVIMASRVLYGLAAQGNLPQVLAKVNGVTHTPLLATALVVAIIFVLAYFLPIGELAEMTSTIVLVVFS
ncbi:MAG: amino acid permease, partial [Alphaproteobacteria bacterium]|nr:amino acid permease [Alphaproteobacteria bacterium]